jgi:hypothetical protein
LIRFGQHRIRRRDIVDFFLESSERFTNPFTDLWELPRSENDQNNNQDNDKFRDPHGTKHGANPYPLAPERQTATGVALLTVESTL